MNSLALCHRYFHFSLSSWNALWKGREPGLPELRAVFREDLFPRRCLRGAFPLSPEEGKDRHGRLLELEAAKGVRAVAEGDAAYPAALLRHLPAERRPALLYMRGSELPVEERALAVVGTRSPSPEGAEAASSFSAYFSLLGIHIVSGLARGIDTLAHRENLKIGTTAVLGSSVTEIYPAENLPLAEEILARGGAVISPFPSGQAPLPGNFPQRNEIIAALSAGVLVVEGAEKSGAAITGKQALAMGKNTVVLAADFRTPFGRGAIRLQQAGANFVVNEEEALQSLYCRLGGFDGPTLSKPPLRKRHFSSADFCAASGTDLPRALAALQEGLLCGRILRTGPDRYRIGGEER